MSWMKEIAIMIEEAAMFGVRLEVSDFKRLGNRLLINGVDADDWFAAAYNAMDRLEDAEI